MKKQLLALKIGGSVITDKSVPYKAKKQAIRRIAKALKQSSLPILLSHGVGSFAHTSAKKYGGKNGYTDTWGVAKVARDAQAINAIMMDILVEEGLAAISFSPRSFFLSEQGNESNHFFQPIEEALRQGLIPVVYGDVIWDTQQKSTIFSGEKTLTLLCHHLQKTYEITQVIELCNVPGMLDQNKKSIPEITKKNWIELSHHIFKTETVDVTGGMQHKVEEALVLAEQGISTRIIDEKSLVGILQGKSEKEGTFVQ